MNPLHTLADSGKSALGITDESDSSVGRLLLQAGKIKQDDVNRILALQSKESKLRFGEAAIKLGLVTQADIQRALSFQFDYPYIDSDKSHFSPELIASSDPSSPELEAMRALRTQLIQQWFALGNQILAVASAIGGEGASRLAANLAIVFSQLGKKILLIDADMRNSAQHKLFGVDGKLGLSDLLAGRADANVLKKVDGYPSLTILAAGTQPPNPAELLSRPVFGQLLDSFRKQYEIIVIDTTPAMSLADCQIVAAHARGVVITARRNTSRLGQVAALKEMLTTAGATIVGAIVVD